MRSLLMLALFTFACSSDDSTPASTAGGGGGVGGAADSGVGGSGAASGGSGGVSAAAGAGGASGAPGVPGVRFIGRVDQTEAGVTKFAWSGSGAAFRFEGTEASVTLDDSARFFTLLVDGTPSLLTTSKGKQTYTLATGLSAGTHEVRLYRRTEASFGTTAFYEVTLAGGTLLPPPPPPGRRIEVIGDSITCGYGNEGADENCNFSADTENHYLTYAAISAREVNADLTTVAWSGKGIVYNYGDDKTDPLPALYDRILPGSASSQWGFGWQPDVVLINLGTNDYSTDDDPSPSLFTAEYEKFLLHLRSKYPSASILALVPTLLGGNDLAQAKAAIESAVAARAAAGDSNVEAFALSFQQSGWGCDYHPSLATHASMAQALTAKLKSLKGW
ncbi:MAG TPA: SGNH/GDSL hydrolase family protein [Polyangiaceae bacterium]|nr:SGNH/GDSL hydrolase family protein [Polyangiaceae bacterium]